MNIVFLSLLSILILALACNDNEESISTNNQKQLNPYELLGKIHNDGLNELQKMVVTNTRGETATIPPSKEEQSALVETFTTNFISSYAIEIGASPELRAEIEVAVAYANENLPFIEQLSSSSDNEGKQAISSLNISGVLKEAFIQILDIVNIGDTIMGKKNFIIFDDKIINSKNLSKEDKESILSVSAIAQYSYLYWAKNTSKASTRGLFTSVAKADLGGAISGVVAGFFSGGANTGLVFGPGGLVLTYAGYAVTGALYGSALSAITGGWFYTVSTEEPSTVSTPDNTSATEETTSPYQATVQ